jgi:hypothetical protein
VRAGALSAVQAQLEPELLEPGLLGLELLGLEQQVLEPSGPLPAEH